MKLPDIVSTHATDTPRTGATGGTSVTSVTSVTSGIVVRCCLLLLCSAYLQGSVEKAIDFPAALAEMHHFGLSPAAPLAIVTIVGELTASFLVISGIKRWIGAGYLAMFTLAATFIANRFWELDGVSRAMSENGFFEHLGLAGAFALVAWLDLCERTAPTRR